MDDPYPTTEVTEESGLLPEESLNLFPYAFDEEDEYRGSKSLNLHISALNQNSEKVLCRIINFPVYCCIELPSVSYEMTIPQGGRIQDAEYTARDEELEWDDRLADTLVEKFVTKLRSKNKEIPIASDFNFYKSVYYFAKDEAKKPYLYLFFRSLKARKDFKDTCTRFHTPIGRHQYVKVTVHEDKVTTFLRLMTKQNLTYSSWFKVKARQVPLNSEYRISDENTLEYFINYETMTPIDNKISIKWVLNPGIVAFDFETHSHKGAKRMPSGLEYKDPITMISIEFKQLHKEGTRRKYHLVYGDSKPIEGVEILTFKREQDMLMAFSGILRYLNPVFLTGYNIYKYDFPYLLDRYEIHHIPDEFIPNFGNLLDHKTEIYNQRWKSSGYGDNSMTFIKASGILTTDQLPNIKRIYKLRTYSLDFVGKYFLEKGKNKFTPKQMFDAFDSYHRGDPDGLDKMTEFCKYCVQDSSLVIDLFEATNMWFHLCSLSQAGGVSLSDLYLRGEQCRCYSQLYRKCYENGFVLSNSLNYDYYYTGGYVGKPIPGVYRYVFTLDFTSLYPSIMQAYNLSYDSFIPIWMWPEIPKECCEVVEFDQEEPTAHYSISRRLDIEEKIKLRNSGYPVDITDEELAYVKRSVTVTTKELDPENPDERIEFDPEDLTEVPEKTFRHYEFRFIKKKYWEGFMPKLEREWVAARKVVKNEIKVLEKTLGELKDEKASLEEHSPKAELRFNNRLLELQQEIEELEERKNHPEEDDDIEALDNELKKLNKERLKVVNILDHYQDPEKMESRLKAIKSQMDEIDLQNLIKDKTQNAIKVVANSGYGFTGVRTGMLSGVFIAICVTSIGQRLVKKANDVLVEKFAHMGAKVVYNDTDSSMISLEIDDSYDLGAIGKEMEQVISGRPELKDKRGNIIQTAYEPVFKDPLKMEFEDVCQMCPIKPKYYLKAIRETNKEKIAKYGPFKLENGKPKIKKKGVLTAKRGGNRSALDCYESLSSIVLFLGGISDALRSISSFSRKLLMDDFDPKDLTKVTELGSDYKQDSYFMNVFGKNLVRWGKPARPGDRLEYLIVKTQREMETGKEDKIGDKCREFEMWLEDPNREPIDYEYYLSKGLETQYDCLFLTGFREIIDHPGFKYVGYKPQFSRCHFVHFGRPVGMIAAMVKDFMKPNDARFAKYLMNEYGVEYEPQLYPRNFYIASLVECEIEKIVLYIEENMKLTEE